MKSFKWFGHKFEPLSFCLVLVGTAGLVMLGNWQLERLRIKEEFISRIETNIAGPPVQLNGRDKPLLYSKVELKGHFLAGRNIFLYGRRSAYPEKDGYYFLSPFKSDSGDIYLVSRGWLPESARKAASEFKDTGEEIIIAFVMQGEEKRFFLPENDLKNNIWFILNLNEAAEKFNVTIKDFYLLQIGSQKLPQGAYPLTSTYLATVRNDHLEYAITWYCLAGFLWIIYYIYGRRSTSGSK